MSCGKCKGPALVHLHLHQQALRAVGQQNGAQARLFAAGQRGHGVLIRAVLFCNTCGRYGPGYVVQMVHYVSADQRPAPHRTS